MPSDYCHKDNILARDSRSVDYMCSSLHQDQHGVIISNPESLSTKTKNGYHLLPVSILHRHVACCQSLSCFPLPVGMVTMMRYTMMLNMMEAMMCMERDNKQYVLCPQVMGGLSNMALWLQIPLASPADLAVQSVASAAACSGKTDSTSSSSMPPFSNGTQPAQSSATLAQAGRLSAPPEFISVCSLHTCPMVPLISYLSLVCLR